MANPVYLYRLLARRGYAHKIQGKMKLGGRLHSNVIYVVVSNNIIPLCSMYECKRMRKNHVVELVDMLEEIIREQGNGQ